MNRITLLILLLMAIAVSALGCASSDNKTAYREQCMPDPVDSSRPMNCYWVPSNIRGEYR